ncbi:hypothetical protein U9M48_007696 [Paspalum notatum var. saurae]|uniref:AT-rich interactive domain-containing protein 2 n=1 Tax=Paspalum notatum var. saurae TaxID=547442 RepID=A0AAQ3WC38_PASNO
MLFTHDTNADQFDLLSYGNLRGLEAGRNTEEFSFGNGSKDGSSVSSENFSFSWLPSEKYQSATADHDKRPLSDVKPCQVACKRPKQTDHSTWLYSCEEQPSTSEVEISAPALADGSGETKQLNHIPASNGATAGSGSSGIPCPNHERSVGVGSLNLPDWLTSFPGYFEDFEPITDRADDIDSPVHEFLPRKGVPIGPEHQADIPEWRPRVSVSVPGASECCADLDRSSASTSDSVPRGDDCESDKWTRFCVLPMPSCSSFVDWARDKKLDCDCSDEGSVRCSRQHIIEARENLKMSLGQDTFCELGLCEMGEDISQRWADDEERLFQRIVFSNPVSLSKNFWEHLPHAFPSKTSQELVSYYFNVFMLRKRAQQNRSDMLHVDSDDDELHGEPPVIEWEEEDSAMESPTHVHLVSNSLPMDDDRKEFKGTHFDGSLHEKSADNTVECRHVAIQMAVDSDTVNIAQDVYDQDKGAHGFKGAHCAELHMSLLNDAPNNIGDQGASL